MLSYRKMPNDWLSMQNNDGEFQLLDIILIDIISFSKLENRKQLELLSNFNKLYRRAIELVSGGENMIEGFISTGDGFYLLVKSEYRGSGLLLGISLKNMAEKFKRDIPFFSGIRVAIHTGYLVPFVDVSGKENYLGNGLNSCARYCDIRIEPTHPYYDNGYLIASEDAIKSFNYYYRSREYLSSTLSYLGFEMSEKFTLKDKHGFSHTGFFIKTEKHDIIILNKKLNDDIKRAVEGNHFLNNPALAKYQNRIKEFEEKIELFYQEYNDIKNKIIEIEKKISSLTGKMQQSEKSNTDKEMKKIKQFKKERELLVEKLEKARVYAEEYRQKENEFVPMMQNLIQKENEKLSQAKKNMKHNEKSKRGQKVIQ